MRLTIGVRDCDDPKSVDSLEVSRVACEYFELVRQGDRRQKSIECSRSGFAAGAAQRCRHLTEHAGRGGIKLERFKRRLGLLQPQLARGLFLRIVGCERTDRKLRQSDDRDQGLIR